MAMPVPAEKYNHVLKKLKESKKRVAKLEDDIVAADARNRELVCNENQLREELHRAKINAKDIELNAWKEAFVKLAKSRHPYSLV